MAAKRGSRIGAKMNQRSKNTDPLGAAPLEMAMGIRLPEVLEPRVLLDAAAIETALEISSASDVSASSAAVGTHDHAALLDALGHRVSGAAAEYPDNPDIAVAPAAEPEAIVGPVEVYFVDSGIHDLNDLLAEIPPGAEVHVLEGNTDGIE
ncbi:MAG: LEPR-XLL domain-containing protein [Notoacmeibacter sp.]|nr:LEPR-XLL domain-containing protein [Notoacmeibacter sp.]